MKDEYDLFVDECCAECMMEHERRKSALRPDVVKLILLSLISGIGAIAIGVFASHAEEWFR